MSRNHLILTALLLFHLGCGGGGGSGDDVTGDDAPSTDNPIMFVTQVPVEGFATVSSTFGNHLPSMQSTPRGGDLMIRYPDGTLRNLTREAGFGVAGEQQGAGAIAVREPTVHWSGERAVFAMVVGAPTEQYEVATYQWQLYEVTGLGADATAVVTKVANQPAYNNVAPLYATDGVDIIFASDRPRGGHAHHYPHLDEYESSPTVTGLYRLTPASGSLIMIEHAPSGVFGPSIDSYGRLIFTKWDHLQRDQQAIPEYSPFTWASEDASAATTTDLTGTEAFPEPRQTAGIVSGHTFNHFFPWEVNEDGTGEETLNHVGRHELGGSYTEGSFTDDPNLTYQSPESAHVNRYRLGGDGGTFHLREDPLAAGVYYAIQSPEFYQACSGEILRLGAPNGGNADQMVLTAVTDPESTAGRYRNPLPLRDGTLVASYTVAAASPDAYGFRLVEVVEGSGEYRTAGAALTPGISRTLTWWDPDALRSFDGILWELDAVEVVARTAPAPRTSPIGAPEAAVLADLGIAEDDLRTWLRDQELALIVVRNATLRDRGDLNQPFNLRVPGGVEAIATGGKVYDVSHLQLFAAQAVRGYDDGPGRRLLGRPVATLPFDPGGGPAGATAIAPDGSIAAFVPAMRAMAWQLTAPDGTPVVRERNWVSFQAGEIRGCPVCHGANTETQLGTTTPQNEPEALRILLTAWQAGQAN